MYCKDCKFRSQTDGNVPECTSPKIVEDNYDVTFNQSGDRLVYSYSEDGRFYVEDYFGCVHFESRGLIAEWKIIDIPFYNEACATCGIPRDLHLGPNDEIRSTPETNWGDLNKCREFKRCDPPKAAYGVLGK